MTGYGKAVCNLANKQLIVEIKALNGKQFTITSKMPESFNEKEIEIRNMITAGLERGKIHINLRYEGEAAEALQLDENKVRAYYTQLAASMKSRGHNPQNENIYQLIMRMPDVFTGDNTQLSAEDWLRAKEAIASAITETDNFRLAEGEMLSGDVQKNIEEIKLHLSNIEPFENERIVQVEERLKQKLNDFLTNSEESKNRFEQEIIYFLDRFDINEEKTRLAKHCEYFMETALNENAPGNKLGFIAQELGREINTIGSKANHAEIQKLVVQMKDALGKIKEQTLNIL